MLTVRSLPQHQAVLAEVPPAMRGHLLAVLQLLQVAQRPLTPNELTDALYVDPNSWLIVPHETQADICELLEIRRVFELHVVTNPPPDLDAVYWSDEHNAFCAQVVRLCRPYHQAIRAGRSGDSAAWVAEAHAAMARRCAVYLMHCDPPMHLGAGRSSEALAVYGSEYHAMQWAESHAFAAYAARYWPTHSRLGEAALARASKDDDMQRPDFALLGSQEHTSSWLRIHDTAEEHLASTLAPVRPDWVGSQSALYHASFHGLGSAAQALLERAMAGTHPLGPSEMEDALHGAALGGHAPIVELLLAHGADATAGTAGPYASALVAGAAGGDTGVLRTLQAYGSLEPDQLDESHPVVVAALGGHKAALIQLLGQVAVPRQAVLDFTLAQVVHHFGQTDHRHEIIRLLRDHGAQAWR